MAVLNYHNFNTLGFTTGTEGPNQFYSEPQTASGYESTHVRLDSSNPRIDTNCCRFEIVDGLYRNNYPLCRSEIRTRVHGGASGTVMEGWYSFSFRPGTTTTGEESAVISQLHKGSGSSTPCLSIQWRFSDNQVFFRRYNPSGSNDNFNIFIAEEGVWKDVDIWYISTTSSSGRIKIWVDGVLIINHTGVTDNPGGEYNNENPYWKLGLYAASFGEGNLSNRVAYFDAVSYHDDSSSEAETLAWIENFRNNTPEPVEHTITLNRDPSAGGTVSGAGDYTEGDTATVTATTNTGYTFSGWRENGSIVSTSNPYIFEVTTDRTLTAVFEETYTGPWHISNSGDDDQNGSEETPFATWEKAVSVAQQGDTIKFECNGTYLPITVNNLDGISSNKYYVTNYGTGANPVISGFVNPTWTSQGSNIWSFQDSGFTTVNILKLGNTNQPKGRLPKTGYNTITGRTGNTQISDTVNLPTFPNVVGGELVSKKNKWILDTQTITAQTSNTITTEIATGGYWYSVGYGYFVQNHANCLTQNGDWYYNSDTKTVYLYHTTNPNSLDIKIGKYENCLYHNNSDYWEFFGIDFEGSVKEAAILRSSHNIKFTRCSFNYHGFNGIQTWLSRYLTIDYCHFNDIQNIGVNNRDTGGVDPSSNALIQNSYFNNISMIAGASGSGNNQACAIKINNTEHNAVIRNNRLHNLGYIGIRFEGNNCLVEKNYAENGCLVKSDGALYYTFGSYTGIQVRDNIGVNCVGNVEGTTHSGYWGVGDSAIYYTDDNSTYITFERNYARGGQYGFYLHNAQYIVASNNIAVGNHIQLRITDDGYNDDTLGDPVTDIDLQLNTWIANAGQLLYEIRSTGTNLAFGIINNNKMRSVDANAFRIRMESNGETDLTLYDIAGWRSNLSYDINSTISDHDEEKELIIVNDSGGADVYELDGEYLDLSGTEYTDSIELDENESIYLYKVEDIPPVEEFTITVIQSEGGVATGGGVYEEGELATLEAISDQDYEFEGWEEDSQIVETENPWIFVVVEDRSITPVFSEIIPPVEEYTVTVIQTPGGSVSGGGTYTEDDEATLTATPNTGWHFVRWSNDITDNPYSFTVTGDVTLQAFFAQDEPVPGVIVVRGKFRIV